MLHFNAPTGGDPLPISHEWYIAKTRFFGLHFRCRKCWRIFNHFYVIRPESYRIQWNYAAVTAITPFKVTEFGTNRKLICDFLLVINSNLYHILHRFWDISFNRSKIARFGTILYPPPRQSGSREISIHTKMQYEKYRPVTGDVHNCLDKSAQRAPPLLASSKMTYSIV